MANTVQIKRSAVAGKVPLTTDLALGELAVNTNDGKLFFKKNAGTDLILQVGAPRVVSYATGSTLTINANSTDLAIHENSQAAGTLTVAAPTGTPVDGQRLMIRIRPTVGLQTYSWNAVFSAGTDFALPTATSALNKWDYLGFIYNSTAAKWHLIAMTLGF